MGLRLRLPPPQEAPLLPFRTLNAIAAELMLVRGHELRWAFLLLLAVSGRAAPGAIPHTGCRLRDAPAHAEGRNFGHRGYLGGGPSRVG